jgi:lysophospholipid acyltransferase (LPLAT)-like uncharacterized protein
MSPFTEKLLLWLVEYPGTWLIALYSRTFRFTVIGEEQVAPFFKKGTNVIYAFWHGRMFPLIYWHRAHNARVLISQHRDGELISRVVERLGYSTVRGSSTSGGGQAMLALKESLDQHCNYGFTPDGPRGPKEKVKPGVIFFAQQSGLPIIPVTAGAKRKKVFASWDNFKLPHLFSPVVIMYGEPILVPKEINEQEQERFCALLEDKIKELSRKADELVEKI